MNIGPTGIGRMNPRHPGARITEFAVPSPASQLQAVAADPDNNMWFTEHGSNRIGGINASGARAESSVPTATTVPRLRRPTSD